MSLSQKQFNFLATSNHSFNICIGAISSGKTFVNNVRFYKCIYESPKKSLLLLTGKTLESLYDNVIREIVNMNPGDLHYVSGFKNRIIVKSKKIEIPCIGANDESSWKRIQGKTVAAWYADEIVNQPKSFVKIAQKSCRLGGICRPKFWTGNADRKNHFIRLEYLLNEKIDKKVWNFYLEDNPVNSLEYIEELKNTFSGVFHNRYIKNQWVNAEGLVYDNFREELHVIKPFKIPDDWEVYRVIDWGFKNPFCCLWIAVDGDGRAYIIDEHFKSQQYLEDHATEIKKKKYRITLTLADHDPQNAKEMIKYGIYTQPANKEIKIGIQKIAARLLIKKTGKARLYVFNNCKNTIREFQSYEWNEARDDKEEKEEPKKFDDHTMDCIRYFCNYFDGVKWGPA